MPMHSAAIELLTAHPVAFSSSTDKRPVGVWPNGRAYNLASTNDKYAATLTDVQNWIDQNGTGNERLGILLNGTVSVFDLDINKGADPEVVQQLIDDATDAGAYIERSSSGVNVHVYVPGRLPGAGINAAHLEAYDRGRYIIVTGDGVNDTRTNGWQETEETRAFILHWYHRIVGMRACGSPADLSADDLADVLNMRDVNTDEGLLPDSRLIQEGVARFGAKFETLISGSTAGYQSQSQADMALLRFLCILSNDNVQVARTFIKTPLGDREKAVRSDYLPRSIATIRATGDNARRSTRAGYDDRNSSTVSFEHTAATATAPRATDGGGSVQKIEKTPQQLHAERIAKLRKSKGCATVTVVQNSSSPQRMNYNPHQKWIEVMEYPDFDAVMLLAQHGYAVRLAPEAELRKKSTAQETPPITDEENDQEHQETPFLATDFDADAYYGGSEAATPYMIDTEPEHLDIETGISKDVLAELADINARAMAFDEDACLASIRRACAGDDDIPADEWDAIDEANKELACINAEEAANEALEAIYRLAQGLDSLKPKERRQEPENAVSVDSQTFVVDQIAESSETVMDSEPEDDVDPVAFNNSYSSSKNGTTVYSNSDIQDLQSEIDSINPDTLAPGSIDAMYYEQLKTSLTYALEQVKQTDHERAERAGYSIDEEKDVHVEYDGVPVVEETFLRFDVNNPGDHGPLPGNAHKIVEHFRLQSTRGQYDYAASALITVASGLAGRFYKVGRESLTNYFFIVGKSGAGKSIVSDVFNQAIKWRGKIRSTDGVIASRPTSTRAVINMFNHRSPSFALNYNELASEIQNSVSSQNTMRQNSLLEILKVAFDGGDMASNLSLDYAKKDDSTAVPPSPNLSFIGEFDDSVMETLFSCPKLINDGTVARFNFVLGDEKINRTHQRITISDADTDPVVKETFQRLWRIHSMSAGENVWHDGNPELKDIVCTAEARALYREISNKIERKMDYVNHQMCSNVMNRAYMRIIRIAGAVAVINNPDNPIIDEEIMLWAGRFVINSLNRIAYHAAMATLDISDRRKNFVIDNIRDVIDGLDCPEHINTRYYKDIRAGLVDPRVVSTLITAYHQTEKDTFTTTGREAKALMSSLVSDGYLTKELSAYTVMYRVDMYKMEVDYPVWMERYVPDLRDINREKRQVKNPKKSD